MRFLALLVLSCMSLLSAMPTEELTLESSPLSSPHSDFIYIQQAKVAELSLNPNRLGHYILKVSGNDKTLVYFSDKPERIAGTVNLNQFVKMWQNNAKLSEDNPNAVISYVEFHATKEEGAGVDVLQLSNPHYDVAQDAIIFNAKPLHEYEVLTGKFDNVVIIYDGITQAATLRMN